MGKRILITESQAKLLMEEIDKNDSIQKLIFSEPSSIKFVATNEVPDGMTVHGSCYRLTPIVDGKKIEDRFVSLFANPITINDERYFRLYIDVDPEIRRLGIAEKLYTSFLMQGHPICYLCSNRNDNRPFLNLFKKLGSNSSFDVECMYNKEKKLIGVKAKIK